MSDYLIVTEKMNHQQSKNKNPLFDNPAVTGGFEDFTNSVILAQAGNLNVENKRKRRNSLIKNCSMYFFITFIITLY